MLGRLMQRPDDIQPAVLRGPGVPLAVIAAAPTPVLITDPYGEIVYRNTAAEDLLRATLAEVGEDGMAALRHALMAAIRTSRRYPERELVEVPHGGRVLTAEVLLGDLRDAAGSLVGHVFTWRHITTEVEQAAAAREAAADMEGSSQALGSVGRELESVTAEATVQSSHLATAARELTASIREIATGAATAAESAQQASSSTQSAAARMSELTASIGEIAAMADLISGIAEQTNLLALNATIEAARAGAAGAGFAVVAGEVKELSRNTASATERIRDLLETVRSHTHDAEEAISGTVTLIEDVAAQQTAIAGAVEQQSAVSTTMAEGVDQLTRSTSVAATTAQSALATADSLAATGARLRGAVAD